jgi:hypothetical protein
MRDAQRRRFYAWEDAVVAPRDSSTICFADAQAMVDAIWHDQGLLFPPRVEHLPRQSRAVLAQGDRLSLRLPAETPSWCLLHEIAHALSSTHEGESDGHGPRFVGLYVQLLERYLRLPAEELRRSLAAAGIRVDAAARPAFVS